MEGITKQSDDFSRWYNDVVLKAELADYSPVKGSMVMRPYGYRIWELLQAEIDRRIKALGVENVYFPLFIPENLLKKEAKHVEGFAPQVAWVTQGGKKKLEERLAVRPTSEAIIGTMLSEWVQSYRDLPIKINQWANIVRWEMRTRLFLRTLEFLWQEGHTTHASEKEAKQMTGDALEMYREVMENVLGIHVITGEKSERERFAGALQTLTCEALMRDYKALQMGTSHHLGQNFSKAFDITFLDEEGNHQQPWQTSWGVSTRLIGGIIMAHGDNDGLVLPPAVAPYQVVIVPIENSKEVLKESQTVAKVFKEAEMRVHVDNRETKTPGWKFNEWELRGVPIRLEVGPKEVKENSITAARRDTKKKQSLSRSKIVADTQKLLADIQKSLLESSQKFTADHTKEAGSIKEINSVVEQGFAKASWCGQNSCEEKIQEETKATLRVIVKEKPSRSCSACGKDSKFLALFARAY